MKQGEEMMIKVYMLGIEWKALREEDKKELKIIEENVKKEEKTGPACFFTARAVVMDRSSGANPVSSSLPLTLHRSSGGDGPLERWPC